MAMKITHQPQADKRDLLKGWSVIGTIPPLAKLWFASFYSGRGELYSFPVSGRVCGRTRETGAADSRYGKYDGLAADTKYEAGRMLAMEGSQRVIVTVTGTDRIGIMAAVSTVLAERRVNILDVSQTILQVFFSMVMVADISLATVDLQTLQTLLADKGREIGMQISAQHEDVFRFMHRV
jgi:ACT domain-containing protein